MSEPTSRFADTVADEVSMPPALLEKLRKLRETDPLPPPVTP